LIQEEPVQVLDRLPAKLKQVEAEIGKVVIGQQETVRGALYALFSHGHCLMVGVPGLAKTLLVRAMARCLELPSPASSSPRTSCLGHHRHGDSRGRRRHWPSPIPICPRPVFTQVLLADEINRTPPKTQAALLEAMQEKTVTVAGKIYQLEEPFIVLATQNPIEQEGTYPLPEAQLDRFLFELLIGYPSLQEECALVEKHSFTPLDRVQPVLTRQEILAFRAAIARIPVPPNVVQYAVRLVRATRPEDAASPEYIKKWIRWVPAHGPART